MYNINDCVLVRKTNIFPKNNIVETPINGMAYEFGSSTIMGDALADILREKYPNSDEFVEELHKYDVYFETYRRSIHYTINGVVADSMYGQFNYPYAIIEPLKYHINDESLKGLRVEDTYFTDNMKLSNESIVLVPEEEAMHLEEQYSFNGMNIRTYTGNIEDAIKEVLEELNYDFFVVNNNGYVDGLSSTSKDGEMFRFVGEYAREHGISQAKHLTSTINWEDHQKRMEEAEKIDIMHLQYIFDSGLVSSELMDKINELLEDRAYYKKEFNKLIHDLIEEVGLEQLLYLTKEFNKMMVEERDKKVKEKRL